MTIETKIFGKVVEMSFTQYCYFIYGMGMISGACLAIGIFLLICISIS